MNFVVYDDAIVFRCDDGPKLELLRQSSVSLQADRYWYRRIGWSVLVRGVAHEVTDEHPSIAELEPWAPDDKRDDQWLCKRGARVLNRFDTVIDALDFAEAEAVMHPPSEVLHHSAGGVISVVGRYPTSATTCEPGEAVSLRKRGVVTIRCPGSRQRGGR